MSPLHSFLREAYGESEINPGRASHRSAVAGDPQNAKSNGGKDRVAMRKLYIGRKTKGIKIQVPFPNNNFNKLYLTRKKMPEGKFRNFLLHSWLFCLCPVLSNRYVSG